MNPIVMRSLGARAPPRPNAEAGMMVGATKAAPNAVTLRRRKRRRVMRDEMRFIAGIIGFPTLFKQAGQPE